MLITVPLFSCFVFHAVSLIFSLEFFQHDAKFTKYREGGEGVERWYVRRRSKCWTFIWKERQEWIAS